VDGADRQSEDHQSDEPAHVPAVNAVQGAHLWTADRVCAESGRRGAKFRRSARGRTGSATTAPPGKA
jgi:hypothetical protein